jgi:hypothetical protein
VPLGFAFIEDSAHPLQWDSPDGLGRSRSNRIAAMAWGKADEDSLSLRFPGNPQLLFRRRHQLTKAGRRRGSS